MFKRIVSFVLVCAMLFSAFSIASANTMIEGAKVSSDYEYKVNSDNKTAAIAYYNGNFENAVVIPSKIGGKIVTEIAEGAFSMLWMLESVTIPDSVLTVNCKAFGNCSGLRTVSIGAGVKSMPGNPFDGCTELQAINIDAHHKYLTVLDGVLYVKDGMKLRCYPAAKDASTYTLPNGVTEIGESAFSGNTKLQTLVIPSSVISIHKNAFNGFGQKQRITLDVTDNTYARAYAIDNGMKYVENADSSHAADKIKIGDHRLFGRYEQDDDLNNGPEPIEWIVLDIQDNRILLLTKDIFGLGLYNGEESGYFYGSTSDFPANDVNWENSDARQYMNGTFFSQAFTSEEQAAISVVTVPAEKHPTLDGGNVGNATQDRIFVLSYQEAMHYLPTHEMRSAQSTKFDLVCQQKYGQPLSTCGWHLRLPVIVEYDRRYGGRIGYAYHSGMTSDGAYVESECYSYRMACWVEPAKAGEALRQPEEIKHIQEFAVGEKILLGRYEQDGNAANGKEPIEWQIIRRDGNQALAISKYALDTIKYESKSSKWDGSAIRKYLNEEFLHEAFSAEEQTLLAQRTIPAERSGAGTETQDMVFLLSRNQVQEYLTDPQTCIAVATPYALSREPAYTNENGECRWWLRSSQKGTKNAEAIRNDGMISIENLPSSRKLCIRPAIWINLNAMLEDH